LLKLIYALISRLNLSTKRIYLLIIPLAFIIPGTYLLSYSSLKFSHSILLLEYFYVYFAGFQKLLRLLAQLSGSLSKGFPQVINEIHSFTSLSLCF
jgi:hypothetical protein